MEAITKSDRIASLPWYDLEEIRPATDAFWSVLADRLRRRGFRDAPARLDRSTPLPGQWESPRLLLSQACGYDVFLAHRDTLRVVATPRYTAPGCEDAGYRSFIVVRRDAPYASIPDLHGSRAAINGDTSHSGMNILRSLVAPYARSGRFFSKIVFSGGHVRSLEHLKARRVDVAAVDCVTYELLRRHRPDALNGTRILCPTPVHPAPPYVTSASRPAEEVAKIAETLEETLRDRRLAPVLDTLLIRGAEPLPVEAYRPLADLERDAVRRGCFEFPCLSPGILPA